METIRDNTLHQIETLTGVKDNFDKLSPHLVSRIIDEIKIDMLENKVVVEGLPQHKATGKLIETRNNLLDEIELMLISAKNKTQQPKQDNKNTQASIPPELQTDEAKHILSKALELKLYSVENNIYTWNKSKSLLSYFADLASEYLQLGKGVYDDRVKTSWKPFETLFNVKGLAGARKDYQRTGTLPIGYEIVDKIFD